MSAGSPALARRDMDAKERPMLWIFRRALHENAGITAAIWVNAALLVGAVCALPFDRRSILGLSPWIKPMKFDISVLVYLATIAVLLSLLKGSRRWRTTVGWGVGVAMLIENSIISLQSVRGVRSHMNYTSWFNGVAFGIMGVFIVVNTAMLAMLLGLYLRRQAELPAAVVWGIRLGLVAILVGSVEGVLMVNHGGHTVGAAEGLRGLPFVNWSREHGDLRVAHFFALHALQAMPLAGWALSRTVWRQRTQVATLFGFFAAYAGAVWGLFAQAMAGRPVLP